MSAKAPDSSEAGYAKLAAELATLKAAVLETAKTAQPLHADVLVSLAAFNAAVQLATD